MKNDFNKAASKDKRKNALTSANTSVLIVGAGLTGLTLACDLARRGIEFRIIEKSAQYFPGSRAKILQPRSLEVFDDLGVIDQLLKEGRFHLPVLNYDRKNILWERDVFSEGQFPTPDVPYGSGLWIPQFKIEEVLRKKLKSYNKQVELGKELTFLDQDENGVTATISEKGITEKISCTYLVAADGGRSFVRKFLKISFMGKTLETVCSFAGDIKLDGLDHEHMHIWNQHPDGFVSLTPFTTTDIFQFQADAPEDFNGQLTLALFQEIFNKRSGRDDLIFKEESWLSFYKTNVRMIDTYRVNRIFLGGDAAHIHSPAGGQGMNTGIQDAYNLGWKFALVLNGANPGLLETYQEERLPVAKSVLDKSTKLLKKFQSQHKELPGGMDTLQLGINYRGRKLSIQSSLTMGPLQAGDRAPDAPLINRDGNSITLFDLFRGPHFTLLYTGVLNKLAVDLPILSSNKLRIYEIIPAKGKNYETENCVKDNGNHFSDAYGKDVDIFYLIRPDGYIGLITKEKDIYAVNNYLKQFIDYKYHVK